MDDEKKVYKRSFTIFSVKIKWQKRVTVDAVSEEKKTEI